MKTILVVCTHCGRHARARTTCDFCGDALGAPVVIARARSSRAVAFGAVAALGIACGARTELGGVVTEADASDDAHDAAEECPPQVTVYGGSPCGIDASHPPPKDASAQQDVTVAPPYGSHFPVDDDD